MKKKSTQTLEVVESVPEATQEVQTVVEETGLELATAQNLQLSFAPLFKEARSILEKSRDIVVKDAGQKTEIKIAREYRLALKNIRVESEKTRKKLKEDSLRRGRAIDGFNAILLDIIHPEEKRLEDQEKFVERLEEERRAKLKTEREALLQPYEVDTTFFQLVEMSDEAFAGLLENSKLAFEAKKAAAKKAEEERIAKEKAEAEEKEKLRKELVAKEAALKAEREAAEKARKEAEAKAAEERKRVEAEKKVAEEKARKEREAAEAKVKAEKAAREKLEREIAAAKKAEEDRLAAEQEAKEKAEAAPDKEKLRALVEQFRSFELPTVKSAKGKKLVEAIRAQLEKFADSIEEKVQSL